VAICPGLAITLVDYREDPEFPTVTLPYEFSPETLSVGDEVTVLATAGEVLGEAEVTGIWPNPANPSGYAKRIAGIRVQSPEVGTPLPGEVDRLKDDTIVCRCERVTAGEIRELIGQGYRDMNAIKAITRAGMGACGGKTCTSLILRLFREEGVAALHRGPVQGVRRGEGEPG